MIRRLILAVFVVLGVWMGLLSHPAASQQIESRFNNLQVDFNRVESRLSRVESRLNQVSQCPSTRMSLTPPQGNGQRNLSQSEQMFDRLATLVVEVKQQVNDLEQRVSQIEAS
jgi:uncharacterized phage infection (PIP) family protein YhgE